MGTLASFCCRADDSLHRSLFSEQTPPGTRRPRESEQAAWDFYTTGLIALGKGERFVLEMRVTAFYWVSPTVLVRSTRIDGNELQTFVCATASACCCLLHAHLSKRTTSTPAGAIRHLVFECSPVEWKVCMLQSSKTLGNPQWGLRPFPVSASFCLEKRPIDLCRSLSSQVPFSLLLCVCMSVHKS